MHRFAFLLVLAVLPPAQSLHAQRSATPADSAVRIRFRQGDSEEWVYANLRRAGTDSLHLSNELGAFAVAKVDIAEAEVSRGRRSNTTRGLLVGGGIGAVAGVATAGVLDAVTEDNFEIEYFLLGAALGFVPGALLGAGTGALTRSERWERVDPQAPAIGLYLNPGADGTVVGLSLSF